MKGLFFLSFFYKYLIIKKKKKKKAPVLFAAVVALLGDVTIVTLVTKMTLSCVVEFLIWRVFDFRVFDGAVLRQAEAPFSALRI